MSEDVSEMVTPLSALPLIIKDVNMVDDSGVDTDYTTDMESVTSSTYATRYGTRRSKESPLIFGLLSGTMGYPIIHILFRTMNWKKTDWTHCRLASNYCSGLTL